MRVQSQRNYKKKRTTRIALVAILIIGVGWLLPAVFSMVSAVVMSPFHATSNWLENSSSLIPTFIRDRQSLQEEIETLENELQVNSRTTVTQQRLFAENNRLRGLLGAAEENRILAGVLARPDTLPYDFLQIDRGSNDGIEVGAPVFVGSDIVIGLVVHAAPQYAFVELFTTPGFEATVFLSGPDVVATMHGMGGGVARVSLPQGIPLQSGNLVLVPSVEPGAFGRISYIENEPTQPEQYGYVTPNISLNSLYHVSVGHVSQISQSVEEIDDRVQEEIEKRLVVEGVGLEVSTSTEQASTTEQATTSQELEI
jgi:cell shape-determining protein MreC